MIYLPVRVNFVFCVSWFWCLFIVLVWCFGPCAVLVVVLVLCYPEVFSVLFPQL